MLDIKQFIMNEIGYSDEQLSAFVGSITLTMELKQMRKIAQAASMDKQKTSDFLARIMNSTRGLPLETALLIFNDFIKGSDDEFDLEMKRTEEHEAQNSSDDEFEQADPDRFKHGFKMLSEDQQKDFIRDLHSQYMAKLALVKSLPRSRNVLG